MVGLNIILDGTTERSGPDFDPATALYVKESIAVMGMPLGTREGRPTVIIRAKLPDGQEVFIETTLRLFLTAADALRTRYRDVL